MSLDAHVSCSALMAWTLTWRQSVMLCASYLRILLPGLAIQVTSVQTGEREYVDRATYVRQLCHTDLNSGLLHLILSFQGQIALEADPKVRPNWSCALHMTIFQAQMFLPLSKHLRDHPNPTCFGKQGPRWTVDCGARGHGSSC